MNKKTFNFVLMDIVLMIYFMELVFPLVRKFGNPTIICLMCLGLWLFFSYCTNPYFYIRGNIYFFVPVLYYLLVSIYPYLFGIPTIAHRYMAMALIPLGSIIYRYYQNCGKIKNLKRIILFTVLLSVITAVITFEELLINPYIARSIKSSGEYSEGMAARGIGGYTFIYYAVIGCVLLFHIWLKTQEIQKKVIVLFMFSFAVMLIVKSNYMTALLTVIVSIGVYLILCSIGKGSGKVIKMSIMICVFSVLILNFDRILTSLSDFLPDRVGRVIYSQHSDSVLDAIWQEFMGDRWPTILESIQTWIKNPMFGMIAGAERQQLLGESVTGFGQHSYIMDTFALYGLPIGILNLIVITFPFREKGKWIIKNKELSIAVFISMMMIYCLNNASDSIALMIGIVFPLVRDIDDYLIRGTEK